MEIPAWPYFVIRLSMTSESWLKLLPGLLIAMKQCRCDLILYNRSKATADAITARAGGVVP